MLAGYCPNMTSTRTQPCLAPGSAQREWLERDLAAVERGESLSAGKAGKCAEHAAVTVPPRRPRPPTLTRRLRRPPTATH